MEPVPISFQTLKLLPCIHFGPSYPPEDAYFRGLISFESAIKCCRLNGYYTRDTAKEVPWDAGTEVAVDDGERKRNLAFFLWADGGKDHYKNWLLAEELTQRFESAWHSLNNMHRKVIEIKPLAWAV